MYSGTFLINNSQLHCVYNAIFSSKVTLLFPQNKKVAKAMSEAEKLKLKGISPLRVNSFIVTFLLNKRGDAVMHVNFNLRPSFGKIRDVTPLW